MPPEIRCEIDQLGTRLRVRLSGELCTATAPKVRLALVKCLVDQPDAILVDLDGLVISEPAALSVFSAVAREAAIWPGTPLLICTADARVATALSRRPRLTVFSSAVEALAAEPARRTLSISDTFLPVGTSMRRARDLATEACRSWELPGLAAPAGLVANELVSNAVGHAQTMLDMRLSLGRRYLMITVRDGSTAMPHKDPASSPLPSTRRGLTLVEAVAARWGAVRIVGGKVVWAALRTS